MRRFSVVGNYLELSNINSKGFRLSAVFTNQHPSRQGIFLSSPARKIAYFPTYHTLSQ